MDEPLIDIHTHIYPATYTAALAARDELPYIRSVQGQPRLFIFPGEEGRILTEDYSSLDAKLAYMEGAGISQSLVSLGNPWLQPFDGGDAKELAGIVNAELASYEAATGGRVLGMGCLLENSVPDVVESLEQITETVGLYGAVVGTKICSQPFDAPDLEPVWEALERLRLPLLVHPHHGLALDEMQGFGHLMPLALGFTFETTLALSRMVAAGVIDRHPGLLVIGSHGGGVLPYLAGRLDACWAPDDAARQRNASAPSSSLGRLYVDALVYHSGALRAAASVVGPDHMMFGTDHPFAIADPSTNVSAIASTFSADEASAIFAETAQQLFGLPSLSR